MALDYALLGTLDLAGPRSGYDLSQVFVLSTGNVWSADRPQIYRTLNRLEDQGLVTSEEDADSGRGRKLYHITQAGRAALLEWLAEDYELETVREPNLLKLFFSNRLPLARVREQVQAYRDRLQDELVGMAQPAQEIEARADRLPDEAFFWQLTLDMGRRAYQAQIDWCDHVLAQLAARAQAQDETSDPTA